MHFILRTLTLASVLCSFAAFAQDEQTSQTLFTNVKIFDGVNDTLTSGSVLVEGSLIKQICSNISAPGATAAPL
jgi:hypothetical protein